LLAALALAACATGEGERCNGQTIEAWRGDDFGAGGHWEATFTCSADETCLVLQVGSHNYPNHAFCAASGEPDPACAGLTGRRCADAGHLYTCVNGYRVAPDGTDISPQACSDDVPHCVEPEPGVAFCVADPGPAAECAGLAARPMDFCAVSYAACREASFAQHCLDPLTSVTCLDGILVETQRCDAMLGPPGRCVAGTSIEVSACDYTQTP
jgi:hypothetical protein